MVDNLMNIHKKAQTPRAWTIFNTANFKQPGSRDTARVFINLPQIEKLCIGLVCFSGTLVPGCWYSR